MENAQLESLGILRQTKVPPEMDWLTDGEKLFMLTLLQAGEEGVHKRLVAKEEKKHPELAMRLFAHGLAQWERDRNGHLVFFAITHRGEEVAQTLLRVARNASKSRPHTPAA